MKFSCDQQTLLKALNIVNKAISPRITIPILKGILFTVKDNKLIMTASDMDMTIKHVIKGRRPPTIGGRMSILTCRHAQHSYSSPVAPQQSPLCFRMRGQKY